MNGMKILHINSYYSVSKLYRHLYDQQRKSGLQIDVFIPVNDAAGLKACDFGPYATVSKNHNKSDRLLFYRKQGKIYRDLLERFPVCEYALVHAHSLFTNGYPALRLKRDFGIPYLVAVRNTDLNLFFKWMLPLRKLGLDILSNAEGIVFLSHSYRDQMIGRYVPLAIRQAIKAKSVVIPNGVGNFWLENKGVVKYRPDGKRLKLLQVGDINRNKNLETSVKATKKLIDRGMEAELTVVGPIKKRAVHRKITAADYVKYRGVLTKEDLLECYRQHDIFLLPSLYETFGLVYVEAISQGLPILYSKDQGFDGQFKDGLVGYGVESRNADDIAEKALQILTHYESMSQHALEGSDRFCWKAISQAYGKIYESICRP